MTTTIEAWSALTPDQQAWKKKLAAKALTHWHEHNSDSGMVFREVPLAEFSREELIALAAYTFQKYKVAEEKEMERFRTVLGGVKQ